MGQTERLRGKAQSSFYVLMRGSPDARGIRGALCDAGMAGASVLIWIVPQAGETLCPHRGALASTDSPTHRSQCCWEVRGCEKSQGGVTAWKQGGWEVGEVYVGRTEEGKAESCSVGCVESES